MRARCRVNLGPALAPSTGETGVRSPKGKRGRGMAAEREAELERSAHTPRMSWENPRHEHPGKPTP